MREEKQIVRKFYEEYGWEKAASDAYRDTAAFVDTRAVMGAYHARCMRRLGGYFRAGGRRFLDAGCGAIASPGYAALSERYARRVCVDFSGAALREARKTLGGGALCVQADITRLPFRDGAFDAVLCAHVLYHVPADEQGGAMGELHRVLAPRGSGVVVYTWPDTLMNRAAVRCNPRVIAPKIPGLRWVWRTFLKRQAPPGGTADEPGAAASPAHPPLYFHPHPRQWFRANVLAGCPFRLRCWQSAGLPFSQAFIPDNRAGRGALRLLSALETAFPRLMARIGAYPLFVLRKK
jgi:SAM-dependent methyltransferase